MIEDAIKDFQTMAAFWQASAMRRHVQGEIPLYIVRKAERLVQSASTLTPENYNRRIKRLEWACHTLVSTLSRW